MHKYKKHSKGIFLGSIIATFIAITPYLFSLHESVPKQKIWNTFLFTYDSASWEDANYAMWVITGKLIPLLLLLVWFFTCRHWWHHTIMVPISMYIYQIYIVLDGDSAHTDEFQLMYLIPIMAFAIPAIYLIRARIFNKINNVDKSIQDLEDEFKVSPKNILDQLKKYF